MTETKVINYPPEEILSTSPAQRKNFEHIILWMLCNNDECEWSDFTEDPVGISQSTFSNYKNSLENKGFIENVRRGFYQVTPTGRERYYELSRRKESKRKLSYPPRAILRRRNYDHWILWMLYNNNYCKWSDFLNENKPVYINQSSLSKNLNLLMENGSVQKDNKRYKISSSGKTEYSRMLRLYDLDRQSILEDESKRIEEITKKTRKFFRKYNIDDKNVKFRFLNNILKMEFAKVKNSLDDEEDFKKILLYFSINHPNSYPEYVSTDEFAIKYDIEKIVLEFHILQIVEKEIYPIKFFKLDTKDGKTYYFQAEEKVERVLRAIVDEYVTRFTYLNKLSGYPFYTMYSLIDDITEDICDSLFHDDLKSALKEFLPDYLKYLTYKVETEKQLLDASDKLEGFIYENIPVMLQGYEPSDFDHTKSKEMHRYYLYPDTLKALANYYISDIKDIFQKTLKNIDQKDLDKALEDVDAAIEADPGKLEHYILKSVVLSLWSRHPDVIHILEEQLELESGRTTKFIPVINFLLSFSYLSMGNFKQALKMSKETVKANPKHPLSHLMKALAFGYNMIFKWDESQTDLDVVFEEIEIANSLESSELNIARHYQLKAIILFELREFEQALEAIENAIKLKPGVADLYYKKIHGYILNKRFKEALDFIEETMKKFPKETKVLLHKKAYLFDKMGYYENDLSKYEESLDILDKLIELYPEDLDLINSKVYGLAYLEREEESIELAKKLISLAPENGNYHDSYGEVLLMFKRYKEAIELFKEAINLDRYGFYIYQTFIKMGMSYYHVGEFDLAMQFLEDGIDYTRSCLCDLEKKGHWLKKANDYLLKIKQAELNTD